MAQLSEFLKDNGYRYTIPSGMAVLVNWNSLRWVDAYKRMRATYLMKYKWLSVFGKVAKRIKDKKQTNGT